jgi:hypothetical protein
VDGIDESKLFKLKKKKKKNMSEKYVKGKKSILNRFEGNKFTKTFLFNGICSYFHE